MNEKELIPEFERDDKLDYLNVLLALREIPFSVGRKLLIDFLRGNEKNKSIKNNRIAGLDSFGSLKLEEKEIETMIDNLLGNNLIEIARARDNSFLKLLKLTSRGRQEIFKPKLFANKINNDLISKESKITEADKLIFQELDSFLNGFNDFQKKAIISNAKEILCIAGAGSGKTTLVKLLYRLYDVNEGKILIDNTDIRDVKQESLREEMSIVPQECVLFDDTIYNNVGFSKPNARKEEVMQAIKFAQLDKIIKEFPYKEKTIVGERGVKLSGGEKQRVSIARAILANKKILVLDEATSSLDSQTEYEIQKDLENLMQGRTSIIIAHRLSTVMHADIIIVLKKGKIVQIGNHEELIKQEREYRKLWEIQKGGYIK